MRGAQLASLAAGSLASLTALFVGVQAMIAEEGSAIAWIAVLAGAVGSVCCLLAVVLLSRRGSP